MRRLEPCNIIT